MKELENRSGSVGKREKLKFPIHDVGIIPDQSSDSLSTADTIAHSFTEYVDLV